MKEQIDIFAEIEILYKVYLFFYFDPKILIFNNLGMGL